MEMIVFVLKEINLLDSGEKEFYVNIYDSEEKAKTAMEGFIRDHVNNNGAFVTYEEEDGWLIELSDQEKNKYVFKIELSTVE